MPTTVDNSTSTKEIDGLVTHSILVDGEPISDDMEIMSINVHQEINVITKATIVIADGEPATQDFKITNSKQFSQGKKIEIRLGYDFENITIFVGIIISNSQKTSSDCPMLTLECKDETVKMTVDKNSKHYDKIAATDIAAEFFTKYGFTNNKIAPVTLTQSQCVQFNSSDWDFMISKVDAANLMCVQYNGQIEIKKLIPEPETNDLVELEFGGNIIEFDADMNSLTQSDKVTTITWNYTTQQIENEDGEVVVNHNSDDNTAAASELGKGQVTTIRVSSKKEVAEQKALADTKKIRKALSIITGRVKFWGRLTKPVLPGDFIKLKGLGDKFSLTVFVSAIDHEYGDCDWYTTATMGWSDKFFSEKINPYSDHSSSGDLSSIQGLQTGIITSIIDEEGDFRVKLKLPLVDNNESGGVYARVATLDAGNNRGTFFRPEIHDEVVVGFMNNDPSQPVVLGMLHSSKNAAPLNPEQANNKKGYVSRTEIKIIIDDGEKSITIETPGGNVFKMNDAENKISITDSSSNKITMEPTGITIDAATVLTLKAGTSLSISAPQVSVKADGEMKLEGGAASTVSSSGIMSIKGSMVNIN